MYWWRGMVGTTNLGEFKSINPSNGEIASVYKCSDQDYEKVVKYSSEAFKQWRKSCPERGNWYTRWGIN